MEEDWRRDRTTTGVYGLIIKEKATCYGSLF